ncbi:MAG: hypothetical protein AMJ54_13215 [Deltaproteobacteria bacterium SG8_13]|nr:MAG: hypothetical protein AMJ54_13215 [Deltaproteobacteria bacterium SG8_13]
MKYITENAEGILLNITVQPRASRNRIVGVHGDALKITLTAPPVGNAANKMCIEYLAKCLGIPKSAVEVVAGHSSRRKRLLVRPRSEKDPAPELDGIRKKIKALVDGK